MVGRLIGFGARRETVPVLRLRRDTLLHSIALHRSEIVYQLFACPRTILSVSPRVDVGEKLIGAARWICGVHRLDARGIATQHGYNTSDSVQTRGRNE